MQSRHTGFPARELRINVINEQRGDAFVDTVSETAVCSYRGSGDKFYISYKTDGSRVMIRVENGRASVKRTGEFGSDMLYIPGEETEFSYRTPYGSIPMKVLTEFFEYDLSEDGGVIELGYVLRAGGDELNNRIKIKIER